MTYFSTSTFSPSPCHFKWKAGMNMSPVSRLKKTWAKVKTAKFDVLEVCEADALLLSNTLYPESRILLCELASCPESATEKKARLSL